MRALSLAALGLLAPACFDVKSVEPGIEVVPDANGFVDPAKNELGISGNWYSYGDQYDAPKACIEIGHHAPEECSLVAWPPALPNLKFPNNGGSMCVFGSVAQILRCHDGSMPVLPCDDPDGCLEMPAGLGCLDELDYSNMWGAGIGLDFALPLDRESPERHPLKREMWNAREHGVTGVAFDLLLLDGDVPHLRVEFPMQLPEDALLPDNRGAASLEGGPLRLVQPDDPDRRFPDRPTPSEEHPSGSPFWGAPAAWGNENRDVSPVRAGHNEFRLSDVKPPPDFTHEFDVTRLLGIQFHVPPLKGSRLDYGFCISNLTFLRE